MVVGNCDGEQFLQGGKQRPVGLQSQTVTISPSRWSALLRLAAQNGCWVNERVGTVSSGRGSCSSTQVDEFKKGNVGIATVTRLGPKGSPVRPCHQLDSCRGIGGC